jgi:hypothetical protein
MSVRSEDLKRSGSDTYFMFNAPSNFAIFSYQKKLGMYYDNVNYELFDP